jgi:hypothetical protein
VHPGANAVIAVGRRTLDRFFPLQPAAVTGGGGGDVAGSFGRPVDDMFGCLKNDAITGRFT